MIGSEQKLFLISKLKIIIDYRFHKDIWGTDLYFNGAMFSTQKYYFSINWLYTSNF